MIFGEGLGAALLVFLWIFCILDVIATDETLMRNLPKIVWLIVVIILPDVGSVAWLVLGRPRGARFEPGSTEQRSGRRPGHPSLPPKGPEDSPEFLKSIEERRLRAWEDDLRRREEDLRRKDEDER